MSTPSKNKIAPGPAPKPPEDVAVVCGMTSDGQGVNILRKRGEVIEAGTVRKLESGKPIHGEVVRLTPRQDTPLICDVEVEVAAPGQATTAASIAASTSSAGEASPGSSLRSGPAQVASAQYRKNWDAIYKARAKLPGAKASAGHPSKNKYLLN